jgi:hypothetical protein
VTSNSSVAYPCDYGLVRDSFLKYKEGRYHKTYHHDNGDDTLSNVRVRVFRLDSRGWLTCHGAFFNVAMSIAYTGVR